MPKEVGYGNKQDTLAEYIKASTNAKELVLSGFQASKEANETIRNTWRIIYQNYHGYIADKFKNTKRSNFHFHKIFPQVELEAARFITAYFTHTPYVVVKPETSDSVESARNKEHAMQHYYEKCPNYFLSTQRWVKLGLMYGSGFRIPTWKTIKRKVKKNTPLEMYGVQVGVYPQEVEETIYDGLWFNTYSPSEVYPDPHGLTLDEKGYVGVEEWIQAKDLFEIAKSGAYDITAVNKIPLNSDGQNDMEYINRRQSAGGSVPVSDKNIVHLEHYFTKERWITLANGEIIIRDIDNPLLYGNFPISMMVKTIDVDNFWPIGSVKNIIPDQKLINLFMNLMVDSAISTVYPVWKHKPEIDRNYLISVPNQRIPVENMTDVDIQRMPEMKQDLMALKMVIESNIEEITGYHGSQKGHSTRSNTATSDAIFQAQGDKRIQYDVMTPEFVSLINEARMISGLIEQYMSPETEVRIKGAGGYGFNKLNPGDIAGKHSYSVRGVSESISRALQLQQLIELYKISENSQQYVRMAENGMIAPVPVQDNNYALKQIYEGFGRRDSDKYLLDPSLFGMPLSNDSLNPLASPGLSGAEGLNSHPITGALNRQPWKTAIPAAEGVA